MKLETLHSIIQFLVDRLFQIEYIDPHYVPPTGGCIIVTNHLSRLDPPILFVTPGRDYVTALAADKYKKYLLFRWMLDAARVIWIDRANADFGALRASVEYLRKGVALGIAPEGTRSKGALIEGKAGTALIAEKARVPIVPVGIAGTESGVRKMLRLQRAKITVRFGQPFTLPPIDRNDRAGWLKCSTDEIMCRIAALLPPIYRGFYATHPRLKELLSAADS
jgi:1-acyl-sn-glycerol-3-phosphate acyltransferase